MRIKQIKSAHEQFAHTIQPLAECDISYRVNNQFRIQYQDGWKRRLMRLGGALLARSATKKAEQAVQVKIPIEYDAMFLGERFADDRSLHALLSYLPQPLNNVLLPGCYIGGEDAQFWLRRNIQRLDGCDVYSLQQTWDANVPQLAQVFNAKVHFQQASIEDLPYENDFFDLIATTAVLEHVRNVKAMSEQTARVLCPGGLAWHTFGPLYYSFGADHCISAYGFDHGYDHLLLDESDYQEKINDQAFFDQQDDSNLPFWARNDQFSFAVAAQYIEIFRKNFAIEDVVIKISEDGLRYRKKHPERWNRMLKAGVNEADLLIKSLAVVLRKPTKP